jgi:tRNA-modifying protein YgfZ
LSLQSIHAEWLKVAKLPIPSSQLMSAILIDLSDRAKFRVTGADRVRFLNGQLTNNILELRPGSAIYACALTAKGKLSADLFVAATAASNYLDTESILREALVARLEKYIIADDVTLEDISEDFGLFHLIDPNSPSAGPRALATAVSSMATGRFLIESTRFGIEGIDLWFPATETEAVKEELRLSPLDAGSVENFRIERGIARWPNELSENVIPQEAGLDERAISYTKGCYLGQEVVSRIKSIGHVNRHLRGLVPAEEVSLQVGDKLDSAQEPHKEVGNITSVGWSSSISRPIALGYVRRGFDTAGTTLQVERNNTLIGSIKVCSLPFDSP